MQIAAPAESRGSDIGEPWNRRRARPGGGRSVAQFAVGALSPAVDGARFVESAGVASSDCDGLRRREPLDLGGVRGMAYFAEPGATIGVRAPAAHLSVR